MSWLAASDLAGMGFNYLGRNVRISSRAAIYNPELISIGDNSRIDDFCVLSGRVTMGRNVHIAVMCNIAGGELGVVMEDFSGLAYGCQVFSQSDDYTGRSMTNPTIPNEYKVEMKAAVKLGRHVIVGTNSVVMPGVHVADGCSVGAMTLVRKSTQPWGIYLGNPAKRIKERRRDLLEMERRYVELGEP